jgi:glutathione S-transferase
MAPRSGVVLAIKLDDCILSAESYTVRLMLALLEVPYEVVAVNAYPGDAEAPVLRADGIELRDPGLTLAFLARAYGPSWMADEDASNIARWLAFAATGMASLRDARRAAIFGGAGDVLQLNVQGRRTLRTIEDHLTDQRLVGQEWIAGNRPTIADIAAFPHVALSHDSGLGHENYPAINLWQRRVRQLPGFIGMPGIPDYF